MDRRSALILLFLLLGCGIFLLPSCPVRENSLPGLWRDQSEAALLYDFREDGSVWLLGDDLDLPVFRYEVGDDNVLRLYDGMGRLQELVLELDGDRLFLRELSNPGVVFGEFIRVPQ